MIVDDIDFLGFAGRRSSEDDTRRPLLLALVLESRFSAERERLLWLILDVRDEDPDEDS